MPNTHADMDPRSQRWLAIETSTDTLSLAVACDGHTWTHTSAGGAQASAQTLPQIQTLMAQAGLAFGEVQAVVFGRGPGAFTGLRTACSVAQGLAFGAGVPVLPIDTLLAVADEARHAAHAQGQDVTRVLAVLDARMDQVYTAAYEHHADGWHCVQMPEVCNPGDVRCPSTWQADMGVSEAVAAGNAWTVYAGRWSTSLTLPQRHALPTAAALLRLAPQAWARGLAVPPEEALPLYIRDKVAQTTDERLHAKQQALAASSAA